MKLDKMVVIKKVDKNQTIREEYKPEETRKSNSLIVCGVCFGIFVVFMIIGCII